MSKTAFFFVVLGSAAAIVLLALPLVGCSEEGEEKGVGRLLLDRYSSRSSMTCERFPRVCRAAGSPGPDCCRKQCVNVTTDGRNCGMCGKRCRYGEACCGGECVNVMYDGKNCGGCKRRCQKGSFCKYGMCSYA